MVRMKKKRKRATNNLIMQDMKIINYSHKNKVSVPKILYEFLVCVFSVSLLLALFFSIYFLFYIVSWNYA